MRGLKTRLTAVSAVLAIALLASCSSTRLPETPIKLENPNHIVASGGYFTTDGVTHKRINAPAGFSSRLSDDFIEVLSRHPQALEKAESSLLPDKIVNYSSILFLVFSIINSIQAFDDSLDTPADEELEDDIEIKDFAPAIGFGLIAITSANISRSRIARSIEIYNEEQDKAAGSDSAQSGGSQISGNSTVCCIPALIY
jgi:hypothetical protein